MRVAIRIIFAVVLGGGAMLFAQQTRPATIPTTDPSNPRDALRMLNAAMRQGDVPTIKRLFLATNPSETKMIEADAEMASALADLRRAAFDVFGEAGARVVTGDTGAGSAESIARIEAANIVVNGDTATVTYHDEKESPFVLKEVAGEWKVPVSQLGKPLDRAALEQRLADLAAQRKVVREIARQIRNGEFANAEQAREAWRSRILQAATSQPADHHENPHEGK